MTLDIDTLRNFGLNLNLRKSLLNVNEDGLYINDGWTLVKFDLRRKIQKVWCYHCI